LIWISIYRLVVWHHVRIRVYVRIDNRVWIIIILQIVDWGHSSYVHLWINLSLELVVGALHIIPKPLIYVIYYWRLLLDLLLPKSPIKGSCKRISVPGLQLGLLLNWLLLLYLFRLLFLLYLGVLNNLVRALSWHG
jgi:hypothetical protein